MTIFQDGFDSYTTVGDTIEAHSNGWHIVATIQHDYITGAPWAEYDGHGQVSDWTQRAKRPGELVLCEDGRSKRFYDFASACRTALRDGWNCAPYVIEGETARQKAARAARHDFDMMRAWCRDDWHWCGIEVTASRNDIQLSSASLWGIECNYPVAHDDAPNAYLREVAEELVDEALSAAEERLASLCGCGTKGEA